MVDDNEAGTEEKEVVVSGIEELVQAVAQGFNLSKLRLNDIEGTLEHLQGINETDMQVLRETVEALDVQIIAIRRALESVRGALAADRVRAAPGLPDVFPI